MMIAMPSRAIVNLTRLLLDVPMAAIDASQ